MRREDLTLVRVRHGNLDQAIRVLRGRLKAADIWGDIKLRREGITPAGRRRLRTKYLNNLRKKKVNRQGYGS